MTPDDLPEAARDVLKAVDEYVGEDLDQFEDSSDAIDFAYGTQQKLRLLADAFAAAPSPSVTRRRRCTTHDAEEPARAALEFKGLCWYAIGEILEGEDVDPCVFVTERVVSDPAD